MRVRVHVCVGRGIVCASVRGSVARACGRGYLGWMMHERPVDRGETRVDPAEVKSRPERGGGGAGRGPGERRCRFMGWNLGFHGRNKESLLRFDQRPLRVPDKSLRGPPGFRRLGDGFPSVSTDRPYGGLRRRRSRAHGPQPPLPPSLSLYTTPHSFR